MKLQGSGLQPNELALAKVSDSPDKDKLTGKEAAFL